MIPFHIIVAVDSKHGIGKNGQLPWRLPGELKHFKEVTTTTKNKSKKNAVIMGRKTWDSIPERFRPLPDRQNVVLTRNDQLSIPSDVLRFADLDQALQDIEKNQEHLRVESVFVIGGGEVFREALDHPQCQIVFLTVIDHDFSCDVILPTLSSSFKKAAESQMFQENGLSYRFFQYTRKLL